MSLSNVALRLALATSLTPLCLLFAADPKPQPKDAWSADALIEPKAFADLLADRSHIRPIVIYVGFPSLYTGAHIQNSLLAGPDSKPDGLDQLRQVVNLVPRSKEIVIYCGCCPFDHCPNIRPAYTYLRSLGFTKVSVLHIETNLHTDWVAKGFPVTKGPGL